MGAFLIFSSTIFGIPTGIVAGALMILASVIILYALWVYNKSADLAEQKSRSRAADDLALFAPSHSSQVGFAPLSSPQAFQTPALENREAFHLAGVAPAMPQVSWNAPVTPPADLPAIQPVLS